MAKNWSARFDAARLKETKQAFREIANAMDPGGNRAGSFWRVAQEEIQNGLRMAAVMVRDKARSGAASSEAPRRLYTGSKPAIFAFSDFNAGTDDKRKRSVLVGMRTGLSSRAKDPRLYVTWGTGGIKRKSGTFAGRGLSMSLAALFEKGRADRRIKPKRFFRAAVFSTRSAVSNVLTSAYARAVAVINRNK